MGLTSKKKPNKKKKKNKSETILDIGGVIGSTLPFIDKDQKEIWMMADEIYETTAEDRARMTRDPEQAMMGGGKVMRYFHGGGVESPNKHQGQYDIQVKKIKGKGKVQ